MPLAISTDSEIERVTERRPLYSDNMTERARAVAARMLRTDGKCGNELVKTKIIVMCDAYCLPRKQQIVHD